ncbi:MAG: signal recognition particle protein [Steroidobacteraceae bacterium]
MFDKLTERLQSVVDGLRGKGRLTDDNITDTLRQVRMALLEADVALPVVKSLIESIKASIVGTEFDKAFTPGQILVRSIHQELIKVLGEGVRPINLRAQPPVVILLAGLQGAGKTTTAGKLAKLLKDKEKKRVLLVSTDVYRPAAILQLERLATQIGVGFKPSDPMLSPVKLAGEALVEARSSLYDVLIVDTAGRLHIDADMMTEVQQISAAVAPLETLFVVDSMAGQDAVNAAKSFGESLALTGVILTKADGDARGGAALSVRQVTGKPILFIGVGEKTDALEVFHPERIASRILGMGDVLSLVEDVTRQVDGKQAEKLAAKLQKGKDFDFNDLHEQLQQLEKMGGLSAMMDKLPAKLASKAAQGQMPNDRELGRQMAIIRSMTAKERRFPKLLDASRKRRIAAGSGVHVSEINKLLKSFMEMQKMMKAMSKGGMSKLMRAFTDRMPKPF